MLFNDLGGTLMGKEKNHETRTAHVRHHNRFSGCYLFSLQCAENRQDQTAITRYTPLHSGSRRDLSDKVTK